MFRSLFRWSLAARAAVLLGLFPAVGLAGPDGVSGAAVGNPVILASGAVNPSVTAPIGAPATTSVSPTVGAAETKTTPTLTWATPAPVPAGTPLTSTHLRAPAGTPGTYVYTPPAGTILAAGTHILSVVFRPTYADRYNIATKAVSLTVGMTRTKTTPTLTWATPAPIPAGTPLASTQLRAQAGTPGTYVYTPPAGTILAAGTHALSVVFRPTYADRYNTATKAVSLTVGTTGTKTTPTLMWATPAPIPAGTPLTSTQLHAQAGTPGTFVYTPPAGTTLAPGTHALSVVFRPTYADRYNIATKAVSLVVQAGSKTTPAISWPAPVAVTQGTPLSTSQFNASASVPGTFVYAPAPGTVLPTGTHTLSVVFTPTDSTRYTTATKAVPLVVTGATVPPPPGVLRVTLERVFEGTSTVSFGVPLKKGVALAPGRIGVYVRGARIAADIKPLLYHYDAQGDPTSLRAVLIQFPAALMSGVTLGVDLTFTESGAAPEATVDPFTSVSVESPETALVANRTIVQDGATYRFQESNRRRVTLFTGREPAIQAHFPDGYLAASGILGPQMSADQVAATPGLAGLKFLSDQLGPFVRSANYEDSYALNPSADSVVDPVANYEGWLYDRCTTLLSAYAHTGEPTALRHALRSCSYYSGKITLTGTNRGIFTGKDTPDSKYSHARGLFAYYALTGDEGAFASVHAIADLWYTDPYAIGPYRQGYLRGVDKLWTERLLGTGLEGLYYGFRLTGTKAYLTAFTEVVATAYRHITLTDPTALAALTKDPNVPPFPAQNCFIHNASQAAEGSKSEPWCSGWMSELVIESLVAYQSQTNDPRVDEIFVRLARFLRDTGSAYFDVGVKNDFFLAPSICYDPARGNDTRRLIPLYGAGLFANGTRANYGEYSDFEHCPDATALTAAALRGLVRQGRYNQGGPIGPFPSEGASFLALHHELAACAQRAIEIRDRTVYRDPASWTSAKLAAGLSDPAAFIAKYGIGYPSHVSSPQRKLSWWFNTSLLQFTLLQDAGIDIPVLQPGQVQPEGCPVK